MVGEGHVAGVEHVLEHGQGVHGQVPEGVLHGPAAGFCRLGGLLSSRLGGLLGGPLSQHRHQGHRLASRLVGLAGKHKQQPLGLGGGVAQAGAAVGAGGEARLRLGNGGALAASVETPAVIGAFQLAGAVEAPLRQGHQPVRADIGKGTPTGLLSVEPEHQVLLQQGEGGGLGRVQVLEVGHRIPALEPGLGALLLPVHGDCGGGALIVSGDGAGREVWADPQAPRAGQRAPGAGKPLAMAIGL